jgi:hypothetical protein
MKTGQFFRLMFGSLFLLLIATQTSCQKKTSKAIIVIAVDNLSVGDISCSQRPASQSGLTVLCEESVRFTHAYTTSTLSAPAIASLLTGLYPLEHGLHHNGVPGLNPAAKTFAEAAIDAGYRTAFFSGGPPIFKKTGLHQGFEIFDDILTPSLQSLYKPFSKNIESFEHWLNQEGGNGPFVAFFYVPDLSFLETKTISREGDPRSLTYESQLEEFDNELLKLIRLLRKKGLWRDSVFVVTGLNGRTTLQRKNEIDPINLHIENTQVPLFMKPSQKVRDSMLHWTVDRNVSLTDVGATIFDMIGAPVPTTHKNFPIFSLKQSLFNVETLPPEDRTLLIESGWASWKKLGPLRAAAINSNDYVLYDEVPKYYNLLTDRFELNPQTLPKSGSAAAQSLMAELEKTNFEKFYFFEPLNKERHSIDYMTWVDPAQAQKLHNQILKLHNEHPDNTEFANWLAASTLEIKDQKAIKSIADNSKSTLWSYGTKLDPCWSLLGPQPLQGQELKNCPEVLFRELISWIKTDSKDSSRDWLKLRFAKNYQSALVDRKIFKTNMALHEIWDVSPDLQWKPTYTDVFFSRPENQGLRNSALKSLPSTDDEF